MKIVVKQDHFGDLEYESQYITRVLSSAVENDTFLLNGLTHYVSSKVYDLTDKDCPVLFISLEVKSRI